MPYSLKDIINGAYFSLELLLDSTLGPLAAEQETDAKSACDRAFATVCGLYEQRGGAAVLATHEESTLEAQWIAPVLEALNWHTLKGKTYGIQGKNYELDYLLFPGDESRLTFTQAATKESGIRETLHQTGAFICENKKWNVALDSGKATVIGNPHHQILNYLNNLKVRYGFLTNGQKWRLYDETVDSRASTYYEVDLLKIIESGDRESFGYFYYVFRNAARLAGLQAGEVRKREALEASLKEILYGANSMVEVMGRAIFDQVVKQEGTTPAHESLQDVFHNSLIFAFRLIFMAYYEHRYWDTLIKHSSFVDYSLYKFYENKVEANPKDEDFVLWGQLARIWKTLNEGDIGAGIPMLNGGLFATASAPYLTQVKLNNKALKTILSDLLMNPHSGRMREFKTLAVTHLGSIYEGFLEWEFRYAKQSVVLGKDGDGYEGYFSALDQPEQFVVETEVPTGSIYLSSFSNNRKSSASYYTPSAFTQFQARAAIDSQVASGKEVSTLKIVDNACGSGHYLVAVLNELTPRVLANLEQNPALKEELGREKAQIMRNLQELAIDNADDFIDEAQVLKRILVKQCLYGVDISEIAVELTRLSLWIETFVFGTPLSFLEHHIKSGNSLMGLDESDLNHFLQDNPLFDRDLRHKIEKMKKASHSIAQIGDVTMDEIAQSKALYKEQIVPNHRELKAVYDTLLFRRIAHQHLMKSMKKDHPVLWGHYSRTLGSYMSYIEEFNAALITGEGVRKEWCEVMRDLKAMARQLRFFHWQIEFPEVTDGFDVVIGNPPWDKVKFSDDDFFPQYDSRYGRKTANSEKARIRNRLLHLGEYPEIEELYARQKQQIELTNAYLTATYPTARGSGDLDIYRCFMVKNLALLNQSTGALCYLTPSWGTDTGAGLALRWHIFLSRTVEFFFQFENHQHAIFKDVHASYKIATSLIRPTRNLIFKDVDARYKVATCLIRPFGGGEEYPTKTLFMQRDASILANPALLKDEGLTLVYPPSLVEHLSPGSWAYMELTDAADLELVRQMQNTFKTLNPDYLDFVQDLHMTNDKDLFKESPPEGEEVMPLYQGASMNQYNSAADKGFNYWLKRSEVEARLRSKETSRLIDFICAKHPPKKGQTKTVAAGNALGKMHEELPQLITFDLVGPRLAFREIASSTNERTMIACVLPPGSTAGHKLWLSMQPYALHPDRTVSKHCPVNRLFFMQAVFNSLVVDRFFRYMVNIGVSKTIMQSVPMPQPTDAELADDPTYARIIALSKTVSYYHHPTGFAFIQSDIIPFKGEAHPASLSSYLENCRAEIDALVARIYNITIPQMEHILTNFVGMNKKHPQYGKRVLREMGNMPEETEEG